MGIFYNHMEVNSMALDPVSGAINSVDYCVQDVSQIKSKSFKEEDLTNDKSKEQPKAKTEQEINDAITKVNEFMKQKRTGCEFSYIEKLNRVMITVYDKDTKKVLKEIPPEESLKAIEKIWEVAGLIVDEKR